MVLVYEGLLLFGVVFFFGYGFSAITRHQNQSEALRWAFQGWLFLVLGLYFVWFWSEGRRTLPMKTMGLQLLGPDGGPLSRGRATVRYLAAWLAFALVPLWVGTQFAPWAGLLLAALSPACVLVDGRRRAPWDIAAGTVMVFRT